MQCRKYALNSPRGQGKAMENDYIISCGGVKPPAGAPEVKIVTLNVWHTHPRCNIKLRIEDLHSALWRDIPDAFEDVLEIAAYVYSSDQLAKRGAASDVDTFGAEWRRRFHFHIPVRVPDLWNSVQVKQVLQETLEFLSDDFYDFTFYPAIGAPPVQGMFDLATGMAPRERPESVMLFSGGLDSLAGAVKELCVEKRNAVLVSQVSTPKFAVRQQELRGLLAAKSTPIRPMHVKVRISKDSALGREYTQRSRSFLYAALGATVATVLQLKTLRFYENGVVSLNLPVCAQVIGGRATRTTHPRVLDGFERLFTLLANEPFKVENPFLWDTKAEVIRRIMAAGCGELIGLSRSCAETRHRSNEESHCGTCSQCLDRRFGIIAAKAEALDPSPQYEIDVFTESRPKAEDKILGAAYLERANQVGSIKNVSQFIRRFPEVLRAARYVGGNPISGVGRMLDLYKRHAAEVNAAVDEITHRYSKELRERTLPPDCLVRTVHDAGALTVLPAVAAEDARSGTSTKETFQVRGRLRYSSDYNDIWVGDAHYDLRTRDKARYCIKYLIEEEAFAKESGRHLAKEIDPYVREKCDLPSAPLSEVKIHHYFNDNKGKLPKLREELIQSAGRNGKYYLKVE
jgi:hypothetical protein